jgi:hypothetical protein
MKIKVASTVSHGLPFYCLWKVLRLSDNFHKLDTIHWGVAPPTGRHGFLLYIGQYRTLLGGVVDRLFISSTQWGPMTLPLNLQEDRIGMFNIPAFWNLLDAQKQRWNHLDAENRRVQCRYIQYICFLKRLRHKKMEMRAPIYPCHLRPFRRTKTEMRN